MIFLNGYPLLPSNGFQLAFIGEGFGCSNRILTKIE
jgi:hypothetical protein